MATTPAVLGSYGERLDLRIKQGSDYGPHLFRWRNPDGSPVDLSGNAFYAQMRHRALDSKWKLDLIFDYTNLPGGEFTMYLPASATVLLQAGETVNEGASKYTWDMERIFAGKTYPAYYGDVTVFREVTRG